MPPCYAQLDENSICLAVSELAGNHDDPNMILLGSYDQTIFGKKWNGIEFVIPPEAVINTLSEAKSAKIAAIRAHFEGIVSAIKADAAPYEVATWETQRAEYMAWEANNAIPTPYVSALAAARSLTVPDLMAKIAPKITGMAALQGTQHKLEKLVQAALTVTDVDAVVL